MSLPDSYKGREQSYLKHSFLSDYLPKWAHKLSYGNATKKIWFVDCFAGPDKSTDPSLMDTSIGISLEALAAVERSGKCQVGAVFVEKDRNKYSKLVKFLEENYPQVDKRHFNSSFGDVTCEIEKVIKSDPAFIFVDPFGWSGAEMELFQRLVDHGNTPRDVLVNVMFDFMNRVKEHPDKQQREKIGAFFGLDVGAELPDSIDEEGMCQLYRSRLVNNCKRKYTADTQIPHPSMERTWFELIVGGGHPEVLRVFRESERKVALLAAPIREIARRDRRATRKSGRFQDELPLTPQGPDPFFKRKDDLNKVSGLILDSLDNGNKKWIDIWPIVLSKLHVTYSEASQSIQILHREGKVHIYGMKERQRAPEDDSEVGLAK